MNTKTIEFMNLSNGPLVRKCAELDRESWSVQPMALGDTQSVSAPKTFIVVDHKTRFMLCNHHFSPDRVQSCPVKGCVERERQLWKLNI